MVDASTRLRLMAVAEELFHKKGYEGVSMAELAAAVGRQKASLYHHFAGGKEEIYREVLEHGLEKHRSGIERAINSGETVQQQMEAVAFWLLSQPTLDLIRIVEADIPALSPPNRDYLEDRIYRVVLEPLVVMLRQAMADGSLREHDPHLLAGIFIGAVGAVTVSRHYDYRSERSKVIEVVDLILRGVMVTQPDLA